MFLGAVLNEVSKSNCIKSCWVCKFQSFGAVALKALSPQLARVLAAVGFRRSSSFDLGL